MVGVVGFIGWVDVVLSSVVRMMVVGVNLNMFGSGLYFF